MKNCKIFIYSLLTFMLSCSSKDIESPDLENETSEIVNLDINDHIISTKSDCNLTNTQLFDTPATKNGVSVNRGEFDMGAWKKVEELSDEFNYPGGKTSPNFSEKWNLGYVNSYTGPLPTVWTGNSIGFENQGSNDNRVLTLTAQVEGSGNSKTLECGMISTKATSSYPLFQEARVKVSNSQLANAVWMISNDSGQFEEIDNLETYGPRIRLDGEECDKPYFADRLHLSHHTFKNVDGERLDYQPQKETWMSRKQNSSSCGRDNDVKWNEAYHTYGVKWVSPEVLEYFVDGKRVKIISGLRDEDGIDPENYTTCGDGLTKEMHMLISQAAQVWRYGGVTEFWNSTDIKFGADTKMSVDWIRVYTPTGTTNKINCN
ncbi:MAG: hypothetical protein ABJD66_11330 [Cellulophaga sp.]|uniref:hypothetical protein n=1 Tax=Cellulophaga sp. TaxID=1972202 RepID=UPI0032666B2D